MRIAGCDMKVIVDEEEAEELERGATLLTHCAVQCMVVTSTSTCAVGEHDANVHTWM